MTVAATAAYDSDGVGAAVVLAHADLMDRRMWRARAAT